MRTSIVVLMLTLSVAAANADPLEMTASAHGSTLELTFTNRTPAALVMTTHVRADRDHYDWLTVELSGAAKRTLHFMESRDKSAPVDETIAVGGSIVKRIDLAQWAILADNGDPLAPGTYELVAIWDATRAGFGTPKVKLRATATLTVPAPVEKRCTDKSAKGKGIELLGRQVGTTATIEIGLHNTDVVAHCVASYIKTHEIQSDWLFIEYNFPATSKTVRRIELDDARNKSYPVYVELAPGATAWTRWDLAAWALRDRNKKQALPAKDSLWLMAVYDSTKESDGWAGAVKTSFGFRVP